MALDELREGDEVFNERGFTYIVEQELFERIKPVKVDYISSSMGSGFTISSKMQAESSCGGGCSC